jgi:hypothetical protein
VKKSVFLLLLLYTQAWSQESIALEYTSEVPFTTTINNDLAAIEKELFVSKAVNDIIGQLLATVEKEPTMQDYYYVLTIAHPLRKGTQHRIEGVIKKEALTQLLASETAFYATLQQVYNDTSAWILRYL